MYCRNCGSNLDDRAVVCPHCGVPTGVQPPEQTTESNTIATVGFILSFFVAIAGLICSIIGYRNASKLNGNGKGFALAGIIISSVSMVLAFIMYIVALIFLPEFFSEYFSEYLSIYMNFI